MLEYLRNAADKPLAKFLMFVLIFSFVGWGVADWIFSGGSNETTLVNVGGTKISEQYFNVVHSEKMKEIAMRDHKQIQNINKDASARLQFKRSIVSDLIMNQLLLNRAEDLGFVVSNERIAKTINNDPMAWVNQYRMKEYVQDLRNDELRKMTGAVTGEPLNVPEFMVEAAYNARYATRDIKYDTIKFNTFKVANPTDEQLQAYYAQSPHVVPESRAVSYVFVEADISKPDEDEIGYQRILEIEEDSLSPDSSVSGDSMKIAAEKHHAKFVRLPAFKRYDNLKDKLMSEELKEMVFAMNVDFSKEASNYSEIKQVKKGYMILRVDEIIPEHNAEFKDVKKGLVDGWKKEEQRKKAYVQANDKLVDLNKNGSLKNAKAKSVTRTEGAPLAVLNAAFAGKIGDNTIVEDSDAFYVLHIDKNTAPKQDKKKKESLRKELKNLTKGYIGDDYSQFLKREYNVKFNDSVYKKVIGQ